MDARERLANANRFELKLENGLLLEYRLPQMRELVIAGLISFQTLDQIAERLKAGGTDVEAVSIAEESMQERLADYEANYEKQQRVIASMVVAIDNEPVQLSPLDTRDIPQDDFNRLVAIALRAKSPGDAQGEV